MPATKKAFAVKKRPASKPTKKRPASKPTMKRPANKITMTREDAPYQGEDGCFKMGPLKVRCEELVLRLSNRDLQTYSFVDLKGIEVTLMDDDDHIGQLRWSPGPDGAQPCLRIRYDEKQFDDFNDGQVLSASFSRWMCSEEWAALRGKMSNVSSDSSA